MAFTVETGAIVPGANSYVSVADADTYFADRGKEAEWVEQDDEAKQAALVRATDYLGQVYRYRWKGVRIKLEQPLDWPRAGVITEDFFEPEHGPRPTIAPWWPDLAYELPHDIVPDEVKKATCELALRALAGDLAPDLARGGRVLSETVGEISVTYEPGAPGQAQYQTVTGLLRPLLRGGSGLRRLVVA